MKTGLPLALALGALAGWLHAGSTVGPEMAAGGFAVTVAAPGPQAIADRVLQDAIDAAAAHGGGVVELGPGDFKLSRGPGDETIVIKTGITLRGQGYATHIYLDPATPPKAARYYPVRIGSESTPASNVLIENLRYTGNNAKIGGGSIMGFNARLGDRAALLLSCDNVTIRNCWIYDAQQAAGCTKPGGTHYVEPERLASQFKNWRVCGNTIDTCGNKAIEFDETNGGLIADNDITNTFDGPQVICGSRDVQIRDNHVRFTNSGINITEGSNHIRVSGNHVEPVPTINPGTANGCLYIRTEPQPIVSVISDIVVTGNVFRDQTTRHRSLVKFNTRVESLGCTYRAMTFTGNVFDGDVHLYDTQTPARTTIEDIVLADNVCEGDIDYVPAAGMISRRIVVRGNILRKAGNYTLQAGDWIWSENLHTAGTLEIATSAANNIVRNNTTTEPITDHGTDTILAGNVVRKEPIPGK